MSMNSMELSPMPPITKVMLPTVALEASSRELKIEIEKNLGQLNFPLVFQLKNYYC